jgi:hypothetical protein
MAKLLQFKNRDFCDKFRCAAHLSARLAYQVRYNRVAD